MFRVFILRRARCATLILMGLTCPPALQAAADQSISSDSTRPLSLQQALRLAESQHPAFTSWQARSREADAARSAAALRPPPELSFEIENVLGTGQLEGVSGATSTLGMTQLIERGDRRRRRMDSADSAAGLLDARSRMARLDVRAEVARRFVHLLSDQSRLSLTREASALAADTLSEVRRRVKAARTPLAEQARAEVSVERAVLAEEHAEHELKASRRQLAAAIGQEQLGFSHAVGSLTDLPKVAEFDVLATHLESAPDALQYAAISRLRESELRMSQARRTPDVRIGAGLRRSEATDDVGLVFSASMPLFGRDQAASGIDQAQARLERVESDRDQAMLRLKAQLYTVYQELQHALIEFEAQRDRVVPKVNQALEQTQYAYDRGRYSLLELRDAQSEWLAQRARLIEVAAEYQTHLIEIQRLTGISIPARNAEVQP